MIPATTRLTLTHDADRLELAPHGGMITAWHRDAQPLMRQGPSATAPPDPLSSAAFPLLPYSNRIAHARFTWAGQPFTLTPNFAPEPHAIHGTGWTRPWRVTAQSADHAILTLTHAPDADWPWPFAAEQEFRLSSAGLLLTLRLRNLADVAVPAGLGHHPYFDAASARLRFSAQSVLLAGPDILPTDAVAPHGRYDFAQGAAVAGRVLDHCYQGWSGTARIDWSGRPWALEIAASPTLCCAVVCIPAAGDMLCFEPVSHANNAINRPGFAPMATLGPGETLAAQVHYAVVPSAG